MNKFIFFITFLVYASRELEALTCQEIRAFVNGHNTRRYQLAKGEIKGQPAASNMAYMVWDNELQAKAEKWAATYPETHNPDKTVPSGKYETGENLHWLSTTDRNFKFNPATALDRWFTEYKNYTYRPLQKSDFNKTKKFHIGHYTQMAWAKTMFIGCAITDTFRGKWKNFYVVCNYGPTGNYYGQTPYKTGRKNPNLLCECTKYDKNCSCKKPYGRNC